MLLINRGTGMIRPLYIWGAINFKDVFGCGHSTLVLDFETSQKTSHVTGRVSLCDPISENKISLSSVPFYKFIIATLST